jgi:lipoate-protein ligase B
MKDLHVSQLGLVEYQKAWKLQNEIAGKIAEGEAPPTLLLLEHPHTYTFGRRGQEENLLWEQAKVQELEVAIHWVDRGGDVTYHGPGQLVGYPILPLGEVNVDADSGRPRLPQIDFIEYLRKLEKVLIRALAELGVPTGQLKGHTGVWVQPNVASRCINCPPALLQAPSKIASIGVKVDAKGISRHGFALNVATDMRYWDGILACGLDNQNQISLTQILNSAPNMQQVIDKIVQAFSDVFEYEISIEDEIRQP